MADATTTTAVENNAEHSSDYERTYAMLKRFNLSLTNSKEHVVIRDALSVFRYDETRIDEGLAKLTSVFALNANQSKEKGEQLAASKQLAKTFSNAKEKYMTTRAIAKEVFDDDHSAFITLGLIGRALSTLPGFTKQASSFYTNMLANKVYLTAMDYFGYTTEKLMLEQDLVKQVLDADARHKAEFGEAVLSTKMRDDALEDLEKWMSKFYTVAKEALKKKPELLKALGI